MKYYKKQIAPVLDGFAAKAGNTLFLVVIVSGSVFLSDNCSRCRYFLRSYHRGGRLLVHYD